MIDVRTTITLTGGASEASVDGFTTQTDVVPEPGHHRTDGRSLGRDGGRVKRYGQFA
jgi:hypothetical protein